MTTLARLSLWGPPDRMDDLAAAYDRHFAPALDVHGLHSGTEDERSSAPSDVLNRLFALENPNQVAPLQRTLRHDANWRGLLVEWGRRLDFLGDGSPLVYQFGHYSTPTGSGQRSVLGPGTRRGDWRTFSWADGLPSPTVRALAADPQGRLWMGTKDGLACMDGGVLRFYTVDDGLPFNGVLALLVDRRGDLWVGTGRDDGSPGLGLAHFDGQTWTTYTRADGLPSDAVVLLRQDGAGQFWTVGQWRIGCGDGATWTSWADAAAKPFTSLSSLLPDSRGRMWLCSGRVRGPDKGLSCYQAGTFQRLGPEQGIQDEGITQLYEDGQGRIWAAGARFLHYTPDPDLIAFASVPLKESVPEAMLADGEGRLWVATFPHGLSCWDGRQMVEMDTDGGLPDSGVLALALDRDGHLWCGTSGSGVCLYERPLCRVFTTADGLASTDIYGLYEAADGRLWMGTQLAVSCWDGQTFSNYPIANEWDNTARVFVETDQGQLWMVNYEGSVYRFTGRNWEEVLPVEGPERYGDNFGRALVQADDGPLWIATGGDRAYRWDGATFHPMQRADGLVEDEIRCILKDRRGRLWFGGADGGLGYLEDGIFTAVSLGVELDNEEIEALLEDDQGRLWIATDGAGVACYDGETFQRYTRQDGLLYDRTTALYQDQKGHLWIGTRGLGVCRFDGLVFQTLTLADGLPNGMVLAIVQDREGAVWLATEEGLVRYRRQDRPPQVELLRVVADQVYPPAAELTLVRSRGVVQIEFGGHSAGTGSQGLVYIYRLEGLETDWLATRQGQIAYADLPEGEYIFQVRAVDRDLNYSAPVSIALQITQDLRIKALQEALRGPGGEFVGQSAPLHATLDQLANVAASDLTVLILGETGTGKGLAARLVHSLSPRQDGPFIQINCGAIPEALVESELFGHEKGAFTGATARKLGKVELAQGGTLLLDEIGDMPLEAQVKLLHLHEERIFERVGGSTPIATDLRVIAATNRDLDRMVEEGRFRQDLFFRLQVFPVSLPPLRQRREDVGQLAHYFMATQAAHLNKSVVAIDERALGLLENYNWPGNVRELEHVIQRAVVVCRDQTIRVRDIALGLGETLGIENGDEELVSLEESERRYILKVLDRTGWVIRDAAAILGKHQATLRSRIRKLGIKKPS